MFMCNLTILHSTERHETPAEPAKADMYVNPYSSSKALQFSPVYVGGEDEACCKMHKISSKDLPETQSLSASHLFWKSKNFSWICVKQCKGLRVKCRFFFFCTRALPTTNDFWGNRESLYPLSCRCVCIG